MEKLKSSTLVIPPKWAPKYIIKRIGDEDIIIPQSTRDVIIQALQHDLKFVQVGEYTLMLNGIKSIDPFWGKDNIPPRPAEKISMKIIEGTQTFSQQVENKDEIAEWEKLFGEQSKKLSIEAWSEK